MKFKNKTLYLKLNQMVCLHVYKFWIFCNIFNYLCDNTRKTKKL